MVGPMAAIHVRRPLATGVALKTCGRARPGALAGDLLGHAGISDAPNYLTITPELPTDATQRFQRFAAPRTSGDTTHPPAIPARGRQSESQP